MYYTFILVDFEQISEEMDIRTRKALLSAMVGKVGKRMDTLLIPLELLCCISRTEFSDKKTYIKWQKRQVSFLSLSCIFSNDLFPDHLLSSKSYEF